MAGERTIEGWQLSLKSHGGGRFVSAAFIGCWLCGWLVGEAFAIWFLVKGALALLTGTPPDPGREPLQVGPAVMVGAFLILWLLIWTLGGVLAIAEVARLLWGEDRLVVSAGRLTVTCRRGPVRRVRHFERDTIRRVSLVGREGLLTLETPGRSVELSRLGTRVQRDEAAAALRAELGIVVEPAAAGVPNGWEEILTPEGERALVPDLATRRTQARVASIVTMLLAALTFVLIRESIHRLDLLAPAIIAFVFTVALAAGTLWLALGRMEWRIGSHRLTLRKRYGNRVRDVFEARRLMLDSSTDSDGDPWYELFALADTDPRPAPAGPQWRPTRPRNRRSIARVMNDDSGVRQLAAWLSRAADLELEDRTTPQAREVQLAELRAALEASGRLGRWAAKVVDRLSEGRRKAG